MPLVAHNTLPAFSRLRQEGANVLDADDARRQDIRELHIGLLNMMPDAVLSATERQFFRLVGASNQIAQIYMHPFSLPELNRGEAARAHVERYYEPFEQLRADGLDALIITGANVIGADLSEEPFWQPLMQITDWALQQTTSVLCSCLATHSVVQFRHALARQPLGFKRWGVYEHRLVQRDHPLVEGVNTRFDVPHSRYNDVSAEQMRQAGLQVLAQSEEAGVHLATSADGIRTVFMQGHPEYDDFSLLKEYKREVDNWYHGRRPDYPPFPQHYLNARLQAILNEHRTQVIAHQRSGHDAPAFPEATIMKALDNTWTDTGKAIINNWIGLVYRVTDVDRHTPFMPGVSADDPIGLLANRQSAGDKTAVS